MEPDRTLMDFKGSPDWIAPALRIISEYEGNWIAMKKVLVKRAREMGSNADEEVIISAYTTPMLGKLGLIRGERDELRLTSDGRKIVRALQESEAEGTLKIASLLYEKDLHSAGMLEHLENNHDAEETAVEKEKLAEELRDAGVKGADSSSTRFNGWLAMLKHFGLLKTTRGRYFANLSQIDVLRTGEKIPPLQQFQSKLLECYDIAKAEVGRSGYVPIPRLRDCVTDGFDGLWGPRFDRLLRDLIQTSKELQFVPATHIERAEGGLWLGDKYYFFLAIFPK